MGFADNPARCDANVLGLLGSEAVTYAPAVGDPVEVFGIFDENYQLNEDGNTFGVEDAIPSVWLSAAQLALLPEDPREFASNPVLTIRGQDYTIRERPYDSLGGCRILLHETP